MNKSKLVSIKVEAATKFTNKIRGLIGAKSPKSLFLKTHFGIHTFGLSFPIDVLILDKNKKVVDLKENLPPYRLFFWNPFYNFVLELPTGTITRKGIRIGSNIKLISSGPDPVNFSQ